MMVDAAQENIQKLLGMFEVDVISGIKFKSSVPPCFKCGHHRKCKIGGLYMMLGDKAKDLTITKEMFNRWEDDNETVTAIDAAAEKLKNI